MRITLHLVQRRHRAPANRPTNRKPRTLLPFTITTPALTQSNPPLPPPPPQVPPKPVFRKCARAAEPRDGRGRCTSHLLCIPLLIPLTSTTRAPLEKTLPNFPNQWKVPQRLATCAVNVCVYLRPQMFLHYSGSSSESTSLVVWICQPSAGTEQKRWCAAGAPVCTITYAAVDNTVHQHKPRCGRQKKKAGS